MLVWSARARKGTAWKKDANAAMLRANADAKRYIMQRTGKTEPASPSLGRVVVSVRVGVGA